MNAITSRTRFGLPLVMLLLFAMAAASRATPPGSPLHPTRRALLIGIGQYLLPPEAVPQGMRMLTRATNLNGPPNDVALMKSILLAQGFSEKDIIVLPLARTRREELLRAIDEYLVKPAGTGDLSFLFYAGHGSYIPGGDPKSIFGQDETLVPSDANLGVPDISGSELAERVHQILDHDSQFIGIFDSCHSGTLFRGDPESVRIREVAPSAVRPPVVSKKWDQTPAQRGALILSASQPTEKALEKSLFGQVNGVFTRALFDVMNTGGSVQSVELLKQRAEALMHLYGTSQAPDLDATIQRQQETLMGASPSALPSGLHAVATNVKGRSVYLDVGQATGIGPGAEFERVSSLPKVRIKIKTPPQFTASVAEADAAGLVKIGDAFAIIKNGQQRLAEDARFYIEAVGPYAKELPRMVKELGVLRRDERLVWVPEPERGRYTFEIYFSTDLGRLVLHDLCAQTLTPLASPWGESARKLILSPRPNSLVRGAASECRDKPALFVRLPSPRELYASLDAHLTWKEMGLLTTLDRRQADYMLAGRIAENGAVLFSWMQPFCESQPRTPMPFRGRAWRSPTEIPEIIDDAVALQRLKSWLTLRTPKGNDAFAYKLTLSRHDGKRELSPSAQPPTVYVDESYKFVLVRDREVPVVQQRYLYIFNIDQEGRGICLWPYPCGSALRLPGARAGEAPIPLDRPLDVALPAGVDTLIMLSTDTPLPNANTLFNFGGMIKPKGGNPANELERLLFSVGRGSRGDDIPPSDWAIQHFPRVTAAAAP